MTSKDRPTFAHKLAVVADIFGKKLTPAVVEAYFQAMQIYDLGRVLGGLDVVIKVRKTGMYFPAPADIITEIVELPPTQPLLEAPRNESYELTADELERSSSAGLFMLWCLNNQLEWNDETLKQFRADLKAGRVTVTHGSEKRGRLGRLNSFSTTSVVWKTQGANQ